MDSAMLDKRYREIQAQLHPDRFVSASDSERRLSLQWATRINEAYQTLKKPLSRGQYLLGLAGHDVNGQQNTSMTSEFLMEQMAWREGVAEARSERSQADLEQYYHRVRQRMKVSYEQLAVLLDDEPDHVQAADRVRQLMFLEKLLSEIDEAMAVIES